MQSTEPLEVSVDIAVNKASTDNSSTSLSKSDVQTHMVEVGLDDILQFDPDHVIASANDVVQFNFHRFNHTLTQSSLKDPCVAPGSWTLDSLTT